MVIIVLRSLPPVLQNFCIEVKPAPHSHSAIDVMPMVADSS
jgi:hypothetical protein